MLATQPSRGATPDPPLDAGALASASVRRGGGGGGARGAAGGGVSAAGGGAGLGRPAWGGLGGSPPARK
jgi:hypothetical protein